MKGLEQSILGKYELLTEIGEGSMGTVYLAQDTIRGVDVAIKVTKPRPARDERSARRRKKLYLNEIKAAGLLQHPNIVATYDVGNEGELQYLVMEFVPGSKTVSTYCDIDTLLPLEKSLRMLFDCALALGYAHRKGVIHRDIKPKNILLTRELVPKLADFGIALIDRSDVDETQVIGRIGSPRYMAPEQAAGGLVNNQSDIFSLGVVSYELFTGVSPFADRSISAITRKIMREPHRPIHELNPELPDRIGQVIDRCLKKHPAGRYNDATDLAGDLSLLLDEVTASTDSEPMSAARYESIRDLSFFEDFDEGAVLELFNVSEWTEAKAGDALTNESTEADALLILLSGDVVARSGDRDLQHFGAGDCFGPRVTRKSGTTFIAQSDATVMTLDSRRLSRLSSIANQQLNYAVLRAMSDQLGTAMLSLAGRD